MKKIIKELLDTSLYLLIVLVLTYLVITFVGQRTQVSGSSMEPTLSHEDNLIVDKITYRFSDPQRYDIIVFPFQYEEDTYYIKRIIGMPGETVRIDGDGNIYINDEVLEESYGKEVMQSPGRLMRKLRWRRMNILCWGITATTVRTAESPAWEISGVKILSDGHGSGFGRWGNLGC